MAALNEVEYRYLSSVVDDLSKYAGNGYFVHFGDTPKVGTRPSLSFHSDPKGVYFYNLDWLLAQERFTDAGSQYATDRRYWTVAKLVSENGIVLSKFSYDDLEELAARNNFSNWEQFKETSEERSAANLLWSYATDRQGQSPNAPFRGLDFVYDDGLGIIHSHEANQLVAFNPRAYRVVATGEQKVKQKVSDRVRDPNLSNKDKHLILNIFKDIQKRYGGEIRWKHNLPKLVINNSSSSFVMSFAPSTWDPRLNIEARWGRALRTVGISLHDAIRNMTMEEVTQKFSSVIDMVTKLGKLKKDLLFTPALDLKEAALMLRSMVRDGFEVATEIDNDRKDATVSATKIIRLDGVEFLSILYTRITTDNVTWNLRVAVNNHTVAQARNDDTTNLVQMAASSISELTDYVKPTDEHKPYSRRFYHSQDYEEFLGWVVSTCGIRGFVAAYSEQVEKFENLSQGDREYILGQIKRVY